LPRLDVLKSPLSVGPGRQINCIIPDAAAPAGLRLQNAAAHAKHQLHARQAGVTDAVLMTGYGYAAVPKAAKYRYTGDGNYLQTRDNLKAVVLL
jgi:hypothetical protein